ncbi:MAG: PfkB family carbohydrate kinase [Lachnospirales bacterium]
MSIVCFGEIMLRLAPEGFLKFNQANSFTAVYGGGEANVAVSLANYGEKATFVTKLPNNPIGQSALNECRRYGVNTDFIARGGERIGIYYLEKGASQRASKVVYDRKHSSIAEADPEDFNWDEIFEGATWFHFTGILPATGKKGQVLALEACKKAKEKGITVSCDLNFRKKMWTSAEANNFMSELVKYVDVCIANEEDAEKVFGIKSADTDVTTGEINHDGYKSVATQLAEKFNFTHVAITLRESISASDNNWAAMLYDGKDFVFSKKYPIRIVDRVGGGDSFAGGLIYALKNKYSTKDSIEFAVAASALKHTIEGDFNHVTVDEVKTLMDGDGSGRVQR